MEGDALNQTKEQSSETVVNSDDRQAAAGAGTDIPKQVSNTSDVASKEQTDTHSAIPEKINGPEDGLKTVPEDILNTGPEDVLKTGPEDVLKTGPEDTLKAGPEDVLKTDQEVKIHQSADAKDPSVKGLADGDQFTEPEILDTTILDDQPQQELQDGIECGDVSSEWKGRQKVEAVLDSSSEEEISSGSEKKVRRRKKRPRSTSQASIDRHRKMQQIQEVLSSSPLDIEKLRELAVGDGGLVKDELRRKAWPRLMMIEHMEMTPKPTLDVVKAHKDYQQVVLDVNRSLKRFPPGIDDDYRLVLMDQLTTLIIRVLMKHPDLHYYQGFHDVAITFLLVMGEDVGFEMVEKLAVSHLCDFMRPTMEKTTYYLTYLYPILRRSDPKLHQFLIDSGVGTVFCLPWLITWFAHTLSDYRNVVRLYDFFLATPYLMPMYIATAIVLKKKQDILNGECDMAMQHFILSQVPDTLPFEEILVKANGLHDDYPPDTLQEEVDEFIKIKNEEEAKERKLLMEKKKKFEASRRGRQYREMMYAVSRYNPLPPAQTKMLVKVAFFAITAYFATSLYSYYSESPSLFPFSPRQ